MTTAASSILPILPRRARPLAALGQTPWALLDQAIISAANFAAIILLARACTQEAFGTFHLVFYILLFVNCIQAGIVSQPHNILGATRTGRVYRIYTTSTAAGQLLLAGVAAAIALASWSVAAYARCDFAPLLLALAPTIIAWQIQEFARRVLYTENRVAAAFATDLLGYGGQAAAIVLLYWRHRLTGPSAMYAMAFAFALGGILGVWSIRRSLARRIQWSAIAENWHFGKWLAGGDIVGQWLSAQLLVYVSAAIIGAAAAAVLRAVHTVFGPARIIAELFYNLLPIRFSRTFAQRGRRALHTQMVLAYLVAVPLLGGYCLLVAIFAKPLLWLLYHDRYMGCEPVTA